MNDPPEKDPLKTDDALSQPATKVSSSEDEEGSNENEKESSNDWVFHLWLPSNVQVENSDDAMVQPSNSNLRLVQLGRRPKTASAAARPMETQPSTLSSTSSLVDEEDPTNHPINKERVALLDDDQLRAPQRPGWTFSSPYWSVVSQDDHLLTLTYKPAWQALPAVTAAVSTRCCGSSRTLRKIAKSAAACCGCGQSRTYHRARQVHAHDEPCIYQESWTIQDVQRVEHVPLLRVPGVGPCRAVKLYLRSLKLEEDENNADNNSADESSDGEGGNNRTSSASHRLRVPSSYQSVWERHKEQMSGGQARHSVTSTETVPHANSDDNEKVDGPVITFAMAVYHASENPPLVWKVELPPLSSYSIAVETLTVFQGRLASTHHKSGDPNVETTTTPPQQLPTHLYVQGYQSWSFTGSIYKGQDQPKSAMPKFLGGAFNAGGALPLKPTLAHDKKKPEKKRKFKYQSDFFTCISSDGVVPTWLTSTQERRFPYQSALVDETGGPALVVGWLTQRQQYGVISVDKTLQHFNMHASCQGQVLLAQGESNSKSIETDWAYCQLMAPHSYDEEPMVYFLHAVAAANQARVFTGSLLTGWCSWYHYYENIDVSSLRDNFAKLAAMRTKVPTNVAVVDDGYITAWGDWDSLKPLKFPATGSMQVVANDIAEHGMRPGLWLAPYAADKHSQVVKDHPDWIIRNDRGIPANSANCGKFFYGLDATNPAVREHVYESIRRAVHDWKFPVLKIDFLYAACLEGNGKYDLSMSRAQTMHLALQTIRDAAGPDVFLIGCGCPIASGIGYVDGMRVSADTGPTWYPPPPLPWWDHGTLPCLRSMVRNSMTRSPMGHRWWHNDPDCLLLGETTRLTNEEVASAASVVAMTCGMMLLSDDLTKVSASRLQIVSKIFPLTGVTGVVLDLHCANDSLPSLVRLWCTDRFNLLDSFRDSMEDDADTNGDRDHNAEATYFARKASYQANEELSHPSERQRSCIHVTKGLGTWSVISISNWSDRPAVVHVPLPALLPPPEAAGSDSGNNKVESDGGSKVARKNESFDEERVEQHHGYHVFAFWSCKYSWIHDPRHGTTDPEHHHPISRRLIAHETEIFHIKPVTPDTPQYIGSDLHFSCGQEVRRFRTSPHRVDISLKTDYSRVGSVFVFLPTINTDKARVMVGAKQGRWNVVGNTPRMVGSSSSPQLLGRVLRIHIAIQADGTPTDGQITIEY